MTSRQCPDCGSHFAVHRISAQKQRCDLCATIRAKRQRSEWQRAHPPSTRDTVRSPRTLEPSPQAHRPLPTVEAAIDAHLAQIRRDRVLSLDAWAQRGER